MREKTELTLEQARNVISDCDKIIAEQFEKRFKAVEAVAEYKKEHSLPIYDSKREELLIEKNSKYISDSEIRNYYIELEKKIFELSKQYQQQLTEDKGDNKS